MTENDIKSTIDDLKNKVSKFIVKDEFSSFKNDKLSYFTQPKYIFIIGLPIVVTLVLFFLKPKIIMQEVEVEGEAPHYKISLKKFMCTTVVILLVGYLLIFSYIYKKS